MPDSSRSLHVAVTGASSGIGEAIAREYGVLGARVTLVARRRENLEKIAAEIGPNAHICVHDLSDHTRATEWLADAVAKHGPIDVLINNAGMEIVNAALSVDVAEAEKLLRTNLLSPLALTRQLALEMVARRSGTIVNVVSVAALAAPPMQGWYGASKAGLAMFSETLRTELRGTGVNILTVYPGPVATPMGDRAFAKYGGRDSAAGLAPEGNSRTLAKRIRRTVERGGARIIYPRFYWIVWAVPWLARRVTNSAVKLPPTT